MKALWDFLVELFTAIFARSDEVHEHPMNQPEDASQTQEIATGTTETPEPIPNVIIKTPSQILSEVARSYIGYDASPLNRAPQELSCAECVVNIVNMAFPGTLSTTIVGTDALNTALKRSPRFKGILDPVDGCIVVSPRTATVHGHAGIYVGPDSIASNESKTGLFKINYTRQSWRNAFITGRGLKGYLYLPIETVV